MPEQDLTIYTRRPAREKNCPACRYHNRTRWAGDDAILEDVPDHTCRSAPAVPQSTLDARVRAAAEVHLDRELRIRRERLADLFAKRA
jgi:hypothetical protein